MEKEKDTRRTVQIGPKLDCFHISYLTRLAILSLIKALIFVFRSYMLYVCIYMYYNLFIDKHGILILIINTKQDLSHPSRMTADAWKFVIEEEKNNVRQRAAAY